jgi:hypothetical protein
MKIFKLLPLLLVLSLFSSNSFAEDCASIPKDSSINIFKKIKCNITGKTEASVSTETEKTEKTKKEDGFKIWKKPEWMKKNN